MKGKELRFTLFTALLLLVSAFGNSETVFGKALKTSGYSLTIYVDEGFGERNGHVFVGLTAGQTTVYGGWYSENKAFDAIWGGNGGVIKNDQPLAACGWDVKKTYGITPEGYQRAMRAMSDWERSGKPWSIANHCGDFAETIARMAGAPVNLPSSITSGTRPELFGKYLRDGGGESAVSTFPVNSFVNAGITVRNGDKISIKAEGSVRFGDVAGSGSPEGVIFGTFFNYFDNIPHGALVGRIYRAGAADLDDWFYIGKATEGYARSDGILQLNVNDTFPFDNRGKFQVRVKVCRQR